MKALQLTEGGAIMAMSKKEKATVEAMAQRLRVVGALRWTEELKPDVPPPSNGSGGYSAGWSSNGYDGRVEQGWSTLVTHGSGPIPEPGKYRSGSQQSRWLHSTKLRALKASRYMVALKFATELAKIDKWIEEEEEIQ